MHPLVRLLNFSDAPGTTRRTWGGHGRFALQNGGISPDTILDGREILSRQRFGVDAREGRSG
ncbi:hypothetical protein BQ8482_480019 [Mesorhizobium delmotii]|uniref:Uncharacterized protein n=1 Tax=Mesorhizobium delmotii TaxID=1631247 RepID=A0A2P9ATN7_9HYPH|nr:hypothetical protein BQ8482_480019 [Mesorhizobium delmotii]